MAACLAATVFLSACMGETGDAVVFVYGDDQTLPLEVWLREYKPVEQFERHRLHQTSHRRLTAPDICNGRGIGI